MSIDRTEARASEQTPNRPAIVGDVVFGGADSPVAVCTLGSRALLSELAGRPEVFIAGRVFTENLGVEKMVENLAGMSSIRYLIVCGRETQHLVGQTIVALHASGLDEHRRVVGSRAPEPVLPNLSLENLHAFQTRVTVLDLIGVGDADAITAEARRLAELSPPSEDTDASSSLAPTRVAPGPEAETVAARRDPANAWVYDSVGYFVIVVDRARRVVRAEQHAADHQLVRTVEGRAAEEICHTIVRMDQVTLLPHAMYLGRELAKAEAALALGLTYEQDRPLARPASEAPGPTHAQQQEESRGDSSGDLGTP